MRDLNESREESEQVLDALRADQVDALVIRRNDSEEIFALTRLDELQRATSELTQAGSERRRAEAERIEVQQRFETLATHAPIGIVMYDIADRCVYANKRCREIVGLSATDTLERGILGGIHPDEREAVIRRRGAAVAAGTIFESEFRFRSAKGEDTWVAALSVPLLAEDGKRLGRIGIISDITGRKKAEDELLESRRELRELLVEQERLTQDLHDGCIQSLYAIGLNLQSSLRSLHDKRETARAIGSAAANLDLVIEELRVFLNHPRGQASPTLDLLREFERTAQAVGGNGPTFTLEIDAACARSFAPVQALHVLQITREAVSNALRHSGARQGSIVLRRAAGAVQLEIRDDGVGFAPRATQKGGLGLHHIEARARAMGGEASVVSAPNAGTRVVIKVPLKA